MNLLCLNGSSIVKHKKPRKMRGYLPNRLGYFLFFFLCSISHSTFKWSYQTVTSPLTTSSAQLPRYVSGRLIQSFINSLISLNNLSNIQFLNHINPPRMVDSVQRYVLLHIDGALVYPYSPS